MRKYRIYIPNPFVQYISYPLKATLGLSASRPKQSCKTSEHTTSAFFSRASNYLIGINKSDDWLFTWSDADRAASILLPTILAFSPYYNNIPLTSVDSPLHELYWDFIGTFSLVKQDTDYDRAIRMGITGIFRRKG